MLMHILHAVAARPNFIKVAPVIQELSRRKSFRQTIVHTGQHYDLNMSDVFFQQLGVPQPDFNLEVGSGSHALQTAAIMTRFEPLLLQQRPDLVLVYGDVNSTAAVALVCAKLLVPVGHVEAGLRSFDRSMPEEINRLVTDQVSDILFTPSTDGNVNLAREGVAENKIHFVGNVMIDTLVSLLPTALRNYKRLHSTFNVESYGLVTLHRPSNVDDKATLGKLVDALSDISRDLPLIFPIHPRTRNQLDGLSLESSSHLQLVDPLGYLDFLALEYHAKAVITDSGGIQEETSFLGVPCLTVRQNTERPITVQAGTNTLVGGDMDQLRGEVRRILSGDAKKGSVPQLWDGHAAERIADVILKRGSRT